MVSKIKRRRWMLMRKDRTEVWGGTPGSFRFHPWPNVGTFAVKTYCSREKALQNMPKDRGPECYEAVPILETIDIILGGMHDEI